MGLTANHIIADIRNIASSGPASVDFRVADEQILYWINEIRSMLISQSLQKGSDMSDSWIQTLTCVDLEDIDSAECCDVESGCIVSRTVIELPEPVEVNGNDLILTVAGIDGTPLFKSNQFRARFVNNSKFTKGKPFWYPKNNRIYIGNADMLSKINITAVFENPADLSNFTTCAGDACYSNDSDYPVTLKMASQITDIIMQTKVRPFMLFNQDTNNNSKDETLPIGK